jgi:hypothetical protein
MNEIAMGAVDLDGVESEPCGALRRFHEGLAHAVEAGVVERQRLDLAVLL